MTHSHSNEDGPRIAVVGAGIVGASIAFHLSLRGASVTVVDAGEPGGGVSAASMSWINAADKNPRHYSDLNRRSLDMWDRFARRLSGDVGLSWGGELRWVATPKGADALTARVRTHQSLGYPMRLVDPSELTQLEPTLSAGTVAAASYAEIEGHVDAVRVVGACMAYASERGASVRSHTRVCDLHLGRSASGPPRVEALGVEGGRIPCDVVVLAAGSNTPELAAHAGLELPLNDTFGAVIVTKPIPRVFDNVAVVQTPRDLDPRVTLRQLPDGAFMIHGLSGTGEGSMGRTDAEVAQVIDTATRFVPVLRGVTIAEVRRGGRPVPADGQPVLGFAQAVPNVYLAVMHNAITLAPIVGEFAAIEILDGATIDLLEPYRIERFN